jgi:hypothetical protein
MAARSAARPPVSFSGAAGYRNYLSWQRGRECRTADPAEAFPVAVRHSLKDHQPRATNLLHITTRRLSIRTSDVAPLKPPSL